MYAIQSNNQLINNLIFPEAFMKLFRKAALDINFRNLCIKNAEAALSEENIIPEKGVKIQFSEGNVSGAYTLPPFLADHNVMTEFVDAVDDGSPTKTRTATGSSTGACSCRTCCV